MIHAVSDEGDDIDEVVGTSLDKGVELDALAKKPDAERKELIERGVSEPLPDQIPLYPFALK